MSQHIERELKTALTPEQYQTLFDFFDCSKRTQIIQENHYFDTPDRHLISQHAGLRMRVTPDHGELTLKEKLSNNSMLETTDSLTCDQVHLALHSEILPAASVAKQLEKYAISLKDVIKIGYLKTIRFEISHDQGVWVLDQSFFPTGISYELEFEYLSDASPFFSFLNAHGIAYTPLSSKMSRALIV